MFMQSPCLWCRHGNCPDPRVSQKCLQLYETCMTCFHLSCRTFVMVTLWIFIFLCLFWPIDSTGNPRPELLLLYVTNNSNITNYILYFLVSFAKCFTFITCSDNTSLKSACNKPEEKKCKCAAVHETHLVPTLYLPCTYLEPEYATLS